MIKVLHPKHKTAVLNCRFVIHTVFILHGAVSYNVTALTNVLKQLSEQSTLPVSIRDKVHSYQYISKLKICAVELP